MNKTMKRGRQEGAIERVRKNLDAYYKQYESTKDDEKREVLKVRIQRAEVTLENTMRKMKPV